ncbi:MAG: modification methylase, partial [Tidjanibacter sp.]|nr:modification methylase [Tidjanibacter sp.]
GDHREGMIRVSGVTWFTNLDIEKKHEELILYKHYTPEEYPTYDNYDAINVNKTSDIPCDYDGVMGVPITFLYKHNPEQFELIGCSYSYGDCGMHHLQTPWTCLLYGRDIYKRLFIRKRK